MRDNHQRRRKTKERNGTRMQACGAHAKRRRMGWKGGHMLGRDGVNELMTEDSGAEGTRSKG